MPTTTELTNAYIATHPSIKDCLKKNLINYSKLSRRIARDLDIEKKTSKDAILIACRRYAQKIRGERALEEEIITLLKKGEVEIHNKVIVVILDKRIYLDHLIDIEKKIRKGADLFYAIEGTRVFTLITKESHCEEVERLFAGHVLKMKKELAIIAIKSPKDIEATPGVVSYLYSLFAEHGININETMSCWTDTLFLIAEKDIPAAMGFLTFR